jgi:hypothetical protein
MSKGDLTRKPGDEVPGGCHHHIEEADDHHMKPVLGQKKRWKEGKDNESE